MISNPLSHEEVAEEIEYLRAVIDTETDEQTVAWAVMGLRWAATVKAVEDDLESLEASAACVTRMMNAIRDAILGRPYMTADAMRWPEMPIAIARLRGALAFARSVIKSGEGWTETCEKELTLNPPKEDGD